MTWSEKIVGRPLPREASYRDQILAGFLREDGTPCGRAEPSEKWLRRPFLQLRKKRLVRLNTKVSLQGGRPFGIYGLTRTGLVEAEAAGARVRDVKAARDAWTRDLMAARKAAREENPESAGRDD